MRKNNLPLATLVARALTTLTWTGLAAGCSSLSWVDNLPSQGGFPLPECESPSDHRCSVHFFSDKAKVAARDPVAFPVHFLELYDPSQRRADCTADPAPASCQSRLEILSGYFDPNGEIPKPTDLGLALEGGGSKAASFELGVLNSGAGSRFELLGANDHRS